MLGILFTNERSIIYTQLIMWSATHSQKCGHVLLDESVVSYLQTKVWSSAHTQKCGYPPHHPVRILLLDFGKCSAKCNGCNDDFLICFKGGFLVCMRFGKIFTLFIIERRIRQKSTVFTNKRIKVLDNFP